MIGPIITVKKLAAEKIAQGTERSVGRHTSVMEPPAFVTVFLQSATVHLPE